MGMTRREKMLRSEKENLFCCVAAVVLLLCVAAVFGTAIVSSIK